MRGGREAKYLIQNTNLFLAQTLLQKRTYVCFWRCPMDNATLHTGYRGEFYSRLSERHQRITEQLGLLDRLILWLRG